MGLGENIRHQRIKKGYSQDYIAEQLGYKSYTTIQKWESGVSEPPIKKLKELALLLDIDMNDLANKDLLAKETELTDKDSNDIAKDLDSIMKKLDSGEDGPIRYNGQVIDDTSRILLRNAIELGLTQLKIENKELYNPNKNKK